LCRVKDQSRPVGPVGQKDLEYIDRWSPWLDLQILLRTIPAVIRADGR
jgi:lipopolysaccharide/colanic/teichoic acid biosynthesis glycosyltransferase